MIIQKHTAAFRRSITTLLVIVLIVGMFPIIVAARGNLGRLQNALNTLDNGYEINPKDYYGEDDEYCDDEYYDEDEYYDDEYGKDCGYEYCECEYYDEDEYYDEEYDKDCETATPPYVTPPPGYEFPNRWIFEGTDTAGDPNTPVTRDKIVLVPMFEPIFPMLGIEKQVNGVDAITANVGDTVTYTIIIRNTGTRAAHNFQMIDDLSHLINTRLINIAFYDYTYEGGTVTSANFVYPSIIVEIAELEVDGKIRIYFTAVVAADAAGYEFTNTAILACENGNPLYRYVYVPGWCEEEEDFVIPVRERKYLEDSATVNVPPLNGTEPPPNGTEPPPNGTEPPPNGTEPPPNGDNNGNGNDNNGNDDPPPPPPPGGGDGRGNWVGGGTLTRPRPPAEPPTEAAPVDRVLVRHLYLIGYEDGLIRPQGNITRAEVATIFFRLITDAERELYWMQNNPFDDTVLYDWFNNAISTTVNLGIFEGVSANIFEPNRNITRGELAAVIARFFAYGGGVAASGSDQFNDIANHWARGYINTAATNGWIQGYEGLGGPFNPAQAITRAETAAMINRILGRLQESPEDLLINMIRWADNANESAWYYLYIQSASNSYTFEWKAGGVYELWIDLIPARDWEVLERPHSRPGDIHRAVR